MKKARALLVSVICVLCLTGCVRFNASVTVKSNGKLDVSMLFAVVDMSDYGMGEGTITADQMQEFIDEGWEVEEYAQEGFQGVIVSKKNISPDELSSSMQNNQNDLTGELGALDFNKDGLKYVLDWKVFEEKEAQEMESYKSFLTMSGGYMKLTVTLPVKPSASNATYVSDDGKTLEWDLLNLGPDQSIHLEFTLINMGLIIGVCVFAVVILLVIILAIILSSQKKKAAALEMQNAQAQVMPDAQAIQDAQAMQYSQSMQYGQGMQYGQVDGFGQDTQMGQNVQYGQVDSFGQSAQVEQNIQYGQEANFGQVNQTEQSVQNGQEINYDQGAQLEQEVQNVQQSQNQDQEVYQQPQIDQQPQEQSNVQQLTGVADEIIKLKKLMDDGVITKEEFETQKSKLLGQ